MPNNIEQYLRSLPTSDRVRATAFDAVYNMDDAAAEQALRELQLPDDVKATLWDARGGANPSTPPPAAATAGMMEQSTEQGDPMQPGAKAIKDALTWGGNVIAGMTGMGAPGREAVENPAMTLATASIPMVAKGARAVTPSTARAGAKFQEVMAKTAKEPVNISGPGNAALEVQRLAEHGGSMPKVARDFLRRVTDPDKGDLNYEEARLFYSNLSRLSADEFKRLTPAMKREIGNMRVALNKALEGATARTNTLPQYQSAMREYAQASNLRDVAKQAAKWGAGGLATAYAYDKLSDLVGR